MWLSRGLLLSRRAISLNTNSKKQKDENIVIGRRNGSFLKAKRPLRAVLKCSLLNVLSVNIMFQHPKGYEF